MKKLLEVFIIVLVSIGIAELIQGIILTILYTPNSTLLGRQGISPFMKYFITVITLTLVFSFVNKLKDILITKKTLVKVS